MTETKKGGPGNVIDAYFNKQDLKTALYIVCRSLRKKKIDNFMHNYSTKNAMLHNFQQNLHRKETIYLYFFY